MVVAARFHRFFGFCGAVSSRNLAARLAARPAMGAPEDDGKESDEHEFLLELDLAIPEAAKSVKGLSGKEVTRELELRGRVPTGFWAEDSKALAELYEEEFRADVAEAQARREEFIIEKQRALDLAKQRKRDVEEQREEQEALAKHPRAAFWIKMIGSANAQRAAPCEPGAGPAPVPRAARPGSAPACPRDAQLNEVTPPLLRALSRPLASNVVLCSLDLAHSRFDPDSGALLAGALRLNTSVRRLELEDCNVGPEIVGAFSKVLEENATLANLSFENNPLTGAERDRFDGLAAFFGALQHNGTLLMLNLWRTGLGVRGGAMLAKALPLNHALLSVGVGCSGLAQPTEKAMHLVLERNAATKAEHDRLACDARLRREEHERRQREALEAERAHQEEEEWLERRKRERAAARQAAKEEADRLAEAERLRVEEEKRVALEEEQRRLEAKKRKKAKAKKK